MAAAMSEAATAPAVPSDWFDRRRRRGSLIVSPFVPWLMVGLPVLILVAIVVYPTIWMAYHAFQDTNMMSLFSGNWTFVGWRNFATALTDDRFLSSVRHLVRYLLFGACLQIVLGVTLALILYECISNNAVRITLLILLVLPMMLPPSIVGVLWKFLLQADNGGFNHLLINLHLLPASQRIDWLGTRLSLWSITLVDVWQWTALPLLIVYSGRVSLPPAIYEAARVDGASSWLVLRRITLPMLKEVIAIAFIIRFMDAYKFVDHVSVMTQGGPSESSELPVYIAFQKGIREFQVGEAAAQAWLIFAVAAVLITLFLKYIETRSQGAGDRLRPVDVALQLPPGQDAAAALSRHLADIHAVSALFHDHHLAQAGGGNQPHDSHLLAAHPEAQQLCRHLCRSRQPEVACRQRHRVGRQYRALAPARDFGRLCAGPLDPRRSRREPRLLDPVEPDVPAGRGDHSDVLPVRLHAVGYRQLFLAHRPLSCLQPAPRHLADDGVLP
jgi:multiple sugar transport system permease protein